MKTKRIVLGSLVAFSLIMGGCSNGAVEETEQRRIAVEVETAQTGDVETRYMYSGKVKPLKEATVFSLVNGVVNKVNFEVGDFVNEGDILFEMDTEALVTSLNGLRANYQAGLANVTASQVTLDTVDGAQMQMQIENARITYENAKSAYENAVIMYDNGFISEDDMKRASDGYNQAKQVYELTSTDLIEENKKRAQAGLDAANAQASALSAQIKGIEKNIADAKVKSPITGVVTGVNVVEDVLLSTANVPVTISDMSSVIVGVTVSEQIINSLTKGQEVDVRISAISNDLIKGQIKTINPAANRMGTYDIDIEIINTSGTVKSGMFAEVSFSREKGYNSVVVDRDVVISKNNEDYVFINRDGVAVKVIVSLGIDDGTVVQILRGVEEGDLLVVKGHKYLNDGDLLNAVSIDGVSNNSQQEKGE